MAVPEQVTQEAAKKRSRKRRDELTPVVTTTEPLPSQVHSQAAPLVADSAAAPGPGNTTLSLPVPAPQRRPRVATQCENLAECTSANKQPQDTDPVLPPSQPKRGRGRPRDSRYKDAAEQAATRGSKKKATKGPR